MDSGLSDRGDTGDSGLLLSKYSSSNLRVHTFTYENMGCKYKFPLCIFKAGVCNSVLVSLGKSSMITFELLRLFSLCIQNS